jgi:GT2 family glycosyltransferase
MSPKVEVVILNTNKREDTLECLASLRRGTYHALSIIVLDNASTDGSAEAIRAAYPDVRLLTLPENKGYAGNNNVGIAVALQDGADWILVLNEDTVLAPDCIAHLVAAGESDPAVAFVGPLVLHYDEPDIVQSAGVVLGSAWNSQHVAKNEPEHGQFDGVRESPALSGCALLVRSAGILDFGAVDERFFYYWEETEWCIRAAEHGWKILHAPQARLWHKGVQRNYQPNPTITYYDTRNHLLLMSLHHAPPAAWAGAWFQTVRTLTSWTTKPRWRHMHAHRDAMWQGTWDFLRGRWGMRQT